MKIGIISNLYYPYKIGGAEYIAQIIAEELKKNGNEVFVITLDRRDKMEFVNDIKVYRLKLRNIYWPWNNEFRFKNLLKPSWHLIDSYNPLIMDKVGKILDLEKPDVVECHNLSGFSISIWKEIKKRRIPLIQVLHDYYNICVKSTMFNGMKNCEKQCKICKFYRFWNKKYYNLVDCVVSVSSFVLNRHIQNGLFLDTKKIVIHNGFKSNETIYNRELGDQITFGYIGRLDRHKGLDLLIDSFGQIKDENIKLLIAGEGDREYVLNLKARAHDKVVFIGYQKREEFYKQIDWLIVPSLGNESFPTVVLESIYFGKPVVASIRGGIPEIVRDGVEGFLFEPTNKEALLNIIKKIERLKQDEYVKFSKNCVERSKEFSIEIMIKRHTEVINELAIGK